MENVYISIGSNLGNKALNCWRAIDDMSDYADIIAVSSFYDTEPVGVEDQPVFLNLALCLSTTLSAQELLEKLHETEKKLGRERKIKWGPRIIDLDIIFFGNQVIDSPDLKIPHPEAHKRGFVLEPLNEIAPGIKHPILGRTVSEMLNDLNDPHKVVKLADEPIQNPQ